MQQWRSRGVAWGAAFPSTTLTRRLGSHGEDGIAAPGAALALRTPVALFTKIRDGMKPSQLTSKDVPKGPRNTSYSWDPVFNAYFFQRITAPLMRKQGSSPDDYVTIDEAEKWMDAKGAAKVLGIKEEDLPKLTRQEVEEKWVKAYSQRTNALQTETIIAAEVLLEYLDSTVYLKKSRQYYRSLLDGMRSAVDAEIEERRASYRQTLIYFTGFAVLGASVCVLVVAFAKRTITKDDLINVGGNLATFVNITFGQPKNTEPPPNYATRYRDTPTALEVDEQSGVYENRHLNHIHAQLLSEAVEFEAHENATLVKILNEENDRSARELRNRESRDSAVRIYRREDFDSDGSLKESTTSSATAAPDPMTSFKNMTLREFATLIASQFGGGSHIQRLTKGTNDCAAEAERINSRLNS